jgi:hypothetical protein
VKNKTQMKKISLILVVCALLVNKMHAQDKAFQKGTFSISVGAGLSGYSTKTHYEHDVLYWNGVGMSTIRVTEDTTDGAVATVIPLTLEYGVSNWLSVGARFSYNKFFTGSDSANSNIKPTVKSLDGDLVIGLHFIKTKHFDMPLNISAGYSSFTYASNDAQNNMAKDGGINFGVAVNPRIYFGKHVGMFFNLGYTSVAYNSMTFSNDQDSNLNDTDNREYTLKGAGANFGLGFIVKF